MFDPYFHLFEFGAIFAFLSMIFKERKNKDTFEILILALLYGIVLEVADVHLSQSYFYSKSFIFQIYDIPIAIGAGWAIIYYVAEKTARIYNLKWWQNPFFMAVIALSIDLAIDAVAIRLGFWSWRISLNEEWFGVPYDNLFGWMAVIWTFSLLINLSKQKFLGAKISRLTRYSSAVISPFLLSLQITIYVALSAVLSGKFTFSEIFEFYRQKDFSYAYYPEVQSQKAYFFFAAVFAMVLYLAKAIYHNKEKTITKVDRFSFVLPILIHFFFLISVFTTGIYKQLPILVIISLSMLAFHFAVSLFPVYKRKKNI